MLKGEKELEKVDKIDDRKLARKRANPLDYIFLLRPTILIPVWTFFLLGAKHAESKGAEPFGSARSLLAIFSFTALVGAIYIINQISDRETDRIRGKLFLLAEGIVSNKVAWLEASILTVVSFLLAVFLQPPIFLSILLVGLLLGVAYSMEPVRLKKRPMLDVLANAVGNGIINTLAGWIAVGGSLRALSVLSPYPLAVASVHLATTLADREADEATGLRTSGVSLGSRHALVVSTILMCVSAAVARSIANEAAFAASLLTLPFFVVSLVRAIRCGRSNGLLPAKAATLIFGAAAGFFYPLYFVFLAALIISTRIYYYRRFGLRYPSIG